MNEEKSFKTPKKLLLRMQVVHLGNILFNMQFIALIIMLASGLSILITAIYYLLLLSITCISLGLVYLAFPEQMGKAWAGGETLQSVVQSLSNSWQYTIPIALVVSILSLICLAFNHKRNVSKIIISSLISIVILVLLILKLISGGAN